MFCRQCGLEIPATALQCASCGTPTGVAPAPAAPDPALRMLLPVGRSGYAIAAGYLGLLAPFLVTAPFALLFGILAIRDIRRHPEKSGMGRAILGIVAGGLVLAFWAVILVASR